MKHENMSSFV